MAAEEMTRTVAEKISRLAWFLQRATAEINDAATEENNNILKMALMSLATESGQYAHEWCCQLHSIDAGHEWEGKRFGEDKALTNIFPVTEAESSFEKYYGDLMNEGRSFPHLLAMMNYQLSGIKGSFKKISLLQHVTHQAFCRII